MKKIAALFMSAVLALGITGCAAKDENSGGAEVQVDSEVADTAWKYIEDKGTLTVGITLFEPMNYYDENNELTGFETEFTKAVCEKIGLKPEFQEIDWNQKIVELQSKTIDVIWNGMTVKEEFKSQISFSTPYIRNKQVVVIKASNAGKYADLAAMTGVTIAAETGSAGQTAIETNDTLKTNEFVGCAAQKDVLMEIKAGTTEIGVIDYVMAKASIGEGTDYADLMIVESVELTPEEYAIGIRQEDVILRDKINAAIEEMVADGTLKALAEKYDLADVYAFQ
ncbi:MAG: transporter substrate-binding domain-containing protein [Ruminococcaceae bacterium]|nr:transporter substrate-binding domain-containing protein [Oscillospiraceae bacterium]